MRCLLCDAIRERSGLYGTLFSDDPLCENCRKEWQRQDIHMRFEGVPLYGTYVYNDAFSKCLIQYKECMDEALAPVFLYGIAGQLHHRYHGYTVLLMPSSAAKIKERGFHHLEKMLEPMGLPILDPFEKTDDRSQKEKHADERESIVLRLKEGIVLPKKILLADDTITSGSTLRAALSLLDQRRHTIRIYTVSVNRSQLARKLPFPWDIAIINKSASAGKKEAVHGKFSFQVTE